MWRQNIFKGNPDSDQSISDEEDFNSDLPENCVSFGGQEGLQLQSRLEILKGPHELDYGGKASNLSHKKQTNFALEDEVEVSDSLDEGDFTRSPPRKAFACNSDEEVISDDEENNVIAIFPITSGIKKVHKDNLHSLGSVKQDGPCTWSEVSKETEALLRLNKNASCSSSHSAYSKANQSCRGIKGKAKPKFSFRFQSNKEGLSWPVICKDENDVSSKVHDVPERLETTDHGTFENSIPELLEDFHRKKEKHSEHVPAEAQVLGHGYVEHSRTGLLDGLQDNTSLLRGNSKMYCRTRGKRVQLVVKRSISPLEDGTIDSEDLPEPTDCGALSDDEANHQNLVLAIPEMKRQTISDRFQEALGATCLSDEGALVAAPKPSGIGLFGKLQQVMQSEKERDMDFMKKIQIGATPNNESSYMNVKILLRYLDAKLTVCQCSSGNNIESSQWPESPQAMVNGERKRTIIFSPRVCGDVDLEVGNLIRIHPPWKEVQVNDNDASSVLCTYFSQILT